MPIPSKIPIVNEKTVSYIPSAVIIFLICFLLIPSDFKIPESARLACISA